MRIFVAATKENSELRNTSRHQDPGEFITVLLRAIQEEMECEEEKDRMVVGTLFTVRIILHSPPLQLCAGGAPRPLATYCAYCDQEKAQHPPPGHQRLLQKEEIKDSKCPGCVTGVPATEARPCCRCSTTGLLQYNWFLYDKDENIVSNYNTPSRTPESLTSGGVEYQLHGFLCYSAVVTGATAVTTRQQWSGVPCPGTPPSSFWEEISLVCEDLSYSICI